MKIQLHAKRDGITKLGPGTRFVVWTQGCPRSCPGCMTAASQQMNGGFSADTKQLAEEILQSGRHGLTISGGEPFLQAKALADLIQEVRKKTDLGVMIYTGFTLEELQEADNPDYNLLLEQCDLLVDGPYIDELNDSKNLRGSSNQRAIPLTDRYAEYAKQIGTKPAEIEMFYEEEKIRIVGVPPKNMFKKVKQMILDEALLLPRLDHLANSVNFGRSPSGTDAGVRVMCGLQNIAGIREIYGEAGADNVLSSFQNLISFKLCDYDTRQFVVNRLGENYQNHSISAQQNNLNVQREGHTVEDWQLINLGIGEAIVSLQNEKPFFFQMPDYIR